MSPIGPSLTDLAAASGVEARTIRSWVAQGLLPAPLTRGPAARYPADTLERVLAVRAMRDVLGMPLSEIRRELLVADAGQIAAYAARAASLGPDAPAAGGVGAAAPGPPLASARTYIENLRKAAPPGTASVPSFLRRLPQPRGFEAFERALRQGRGEPARKSRGEEWLRIAITPDVELAVRAPLEAEHRAQLERCADLIRDILQGREP